jgi:hypothetical protein
MAEETAVDFGVSAGPGEDSLSMPLGDFMAFLETESTAAEDGGDEEPQPPGVSASCRRSPNVLCPASDFAMLRSYLVDAIVWRRAGVS